MFSDFVIMLDGWGIHVPAETIREHFDLGMVFKVAANALGSLGSVASNSFMIILTVIFMLFEGASLPGKLAVAFGQHSAHMNHIQRFLDNVKQYMTIKTIISLATGVMIYVWLLILELITHCYGGCWRFS